MTPEQLAEKLGSTTPQGLVAVALYGSAVAGDHAGKKSDLNILVVTSDMDVDGLLALSPPIVEWVKKGNPPPMIINVQEMERSADVFPIEWLDLRERHRLLRGTDVLRDLKVEPVHLRLQIEHELKGKLFQLKRRAPLTQGRNSDLMGLMVESLSSFLVLFRAALRLYQPDIPAHKLEALKALRAHVEFDPSVFEELSKHKRAARLPRNTQAKDLFRKYLENINRIVNAVDRKSVN